MKKLFLFLIIGVFTATLCSCATIMKDDTQTIPIKANVDKVNLKIMNKVGETVFEGQTPTMITLKTAAGGYFNPEKYTVIASKKVIKPKNPSSTGTSAAGILPAIWLSAAFSDI